MIKSAGNWIAVIDIQFWFYLVPSIWKQILFRSEALQNLYIASQIFLKIQLGLQIPWDSWNNEDFQSSYSLLLGRKEPSFSCLWIPYIKSWKILRVRISREKMLIFSENFAYVVNEWAHIRPRLIRDCTELFFFQFEVAGLQVWSKMFI